MLIILSGLFYVTCFSKVLGHLNISFPFVLIKVYYLEHVDYLEHQRLWVQL